MTVPYNSKREEDEAQPGAALAPNPDQVNEFHRYDDSDNAPESHHHTLGVDPNQASPGDHNHDGRNSFLISEAANGLDGDDLGNWGQQKPHGSYATDGFNDTDMTFGADFVQSAAGGPPAPPAGVSAYTQFYNENVSLGSEYPMQGAGSYAMQRAVARTPLGGMAALWHRFKENNVWSVWQTSSPVLLGWGSVSPFNVTAVSHRIKVSVNLEFASGQVGKLSVVVTGSNGPVMNSNTMNVGGDASTAGRDQATSLTKYFNCDPGDVITITPQSFSGTINQIEIYVEACN